MTLSYKQKFNKKYKLPLDTPHSISSISKLTGYKKSGLKTIYNKGIGAYKTNPSSVRPNVKSKEQWAYSRLYASVNPSSKAYKIDKTHLIKQ
jgi:hypothetical protein